MQQNRSLDISSAGLHLLAMALMLCDHLWAMLFPAAGWLTAIGRLAFPIFAFLIAEGYRRTRSLGGYLLRLLIFALISEIPFDLMYGGVAFYPYHQNVLWTFLLSLLLLAAADSFRARLRPLWAFPCCALLAVLAFFLGYAGMVDYYGAGVLTVFVFYLFPGRNWGERLCQLAGLYLLHVQLLGGYYESFWVFGHEVEFVQQGLALFALLPIWLYQGRRGMHGRAWRYFCYAFYPLHMLLLLLLREAMLG